MTRAAADWWKHTHNHAHHHLINTTPNRRMCCPPCPRATLLAGWQTCRVGAARCLRARPAAPLRDAVPGAPAAALSLSTPCACVLPHFLPIPAIYFCTISSSDPLSPFSTPPPQSTCARSAFSFLSFHPRSPPVLHLRAAPGQRARPGGAGGAAAGPPAHQQRAAAVRHRRRQQGGALAVGAPPWRWHLVAARQGLRGGGCAALASCRGGPAQRKRAAAWMDGRGQPPPSLNFEIASLS